MFASKDDVGFLIPETSFRKLKFINCSHLPCSELLLTPKLEDEFSLTEGERYRKRIIREIQDITCYEILGGFKGFIFLLQFLLFLYHILARLGLSIQT